MKSRMARLALSLLGILMTTDGPAGAQKLPLTTKNAPTLQDDCPPQTKYVGGGADGSTRYCVFVEQKALKRCEMSYLNYVQRDVDTTISFDFRLDSTWTFHDDWTSIFQVHSHPDPGEAWRCPVSALEVQGNTLRMFNRYDAAPISTTVNGVCADQGNSIRGRTLFSDVPIKAGEWNHFELQAKFSLGSEGTLAAKLNGMPLGSLSGANTFNDERWPFLKIGIYKPSSWGAAKQLCVDYRNFSVERGTR